MKKNWLNNLVATKTRLAWLLLGSSGLLNAILWALIFLTFPKDAPAAVLHYSVGVGVDFIGEGQQIIVLPLGGLILLMLNGLAAYVIRRASWAATWIVLGTTVLLQVLLLIAYLYILRLNT